MRIIPRIDIKNNYVIKGINFEGLRKVGDPINFAKKYYNDGADEIIYVDCVASLYGQNNLAEITVNSTKDIFIPFCVGGGIRSIEDATSLFKNGADKVTVNTAAIENKSLIEQLSNKFGSQSIVLSVEAKKISKNKWQVYKNFGRDQTEIDVIEWVEKASKAGAGEILLTSIESEGLGIGYDIGLYQECEKVVNIPIIACGGFGKLDHIKELKDNTNIDAIALSQALHYEKINLKEIKQYCIKNKINVRN